MKITKGNIITFTGIWAYPLLLALFYLIAEQLESDFAIPHIITLIITYVAPLSFPITMTMTNLDRAKRGQTDFSLKSTLSITPKNEKLSKAYREAAYPDVPADYSFKVPTGFVIGMQRGKYASCPVVKDGINGFVIGTPGSGKSVLLLSWLYSMLYREELAAKANIEPLGRPFNFFLVDIKGELFERLLHCKASDYSADDHPDFQVVQPSNRLSFGWDVLYRCRENASETQIIKATTDIADALVVETGNNPYFSDNAKKILSGVLYYYVKEGWDFIPIIQKLMRTSFDALLTEIVSDAEEKGYGIVLDKLKGFVGKDDNESIADIESTLKTYLEVFSYPDIQWCLHENPNKTSPAALNDGETNMDLAIEESMLTTYQPIFRLITMQMLRHCEAEFREDDDRYTSLIFDEAARIGNINGLDAAMATLRSKHTALICLYQSISQFKDIYPEQKAMTLLNLCELKIFLSGAGDKDTSEYVSGMVGQYDVTKMSYKTRGVFGGKSDGQYSTERRDIVETKDLMELREKGEAIAFIYGHYVRVKKLRYFEDPLLAPIIEKHKNEVIK